MEWRGEERRGEERRGEERYMCDVSLTCCARCLAVIAFNTLISLANSHVVTIGNNEFHTKDILFPGILERGGVSFFFLNRAILEYL